MECKSLSEIEGVESKQTDSGRRLLGILTIRLRQTEKLTWRDIVEALRSECVGRGDVAHEIEKKYCLVATAEGKQHEKQVQFDIRKSQRGNKQKELYTESDPPMNKEKVCKQDSDSEGEGSEKVKRKSYPHSKANRKGEKVKEVGKTQKRQKLVKVESDDEYNERKRKRRSKQKGEPPLYQEEVSYKQDSDSEGEGSERVKRESYPHSKANRKREKVGKTQKRLEVVKVESDDERKRKRRSKQKGEPPLYQEEVSYKQGSDFEGEGSERVKHSEKPRSKSTRKGEKVREKAEMSVACSPQQEVEMSRKGKNKKEGKKVAKPHFESERETERRKTKATYEKEKSEVVDDHSADYNTNQKQKRRKIESDNESSTSSSDSEIVSLPLQSKTKRKEAPAQCAESFQQKEGKTKGRKRENKGHLATHKATATECSKRPTHKSKISKQVKSKSEEELSSATVSEESDNEISEVEPKRKTTMPKVRKQNFAHKEQIEKKRTGDKRIDKKAKQLASGKEKCPKSGPKSSNQSKKERERGIPSEKKASVVPLELPSDYRSQEECEEEQEWDSDERSEEEEGDEDSEQEESEPGSEHNQVENKRGRGIPSEKKAAAIPLEPTSDDIIEEESGEETRDLDDRSEYEDSEQKLSSEEEEARPDGESSAATSEEEEKRIAAQPERRKHVKGKTSTENASATASRYDVPEQSDPSPRGGVKGAKKKKKKKKIKHKEREMDQSVKPSSSLSTSPEERPKQPTSRGQRRKTGQREGKKGKRRRRAEGLMVMSSSETDDSSSPECDISKKLTEDEVKKISKVFKQFFGQLCCTIVNPVEIAAQLQRKHLISQKVMIDMLNSPETKQAKTISLVLKLSKRIESRPYRMYRFIEVLLGNSVLQGAGREILRETGM